MDFSEIAAQIESPSGCVVNICSDFGFNDAIPSAAAVATERTRLSQDAALYRKDEVVDERLQAVAPTCFELGCGQTQRRVRPLFDNIQICRHRLQGMPQPSQLGTHFYTHGRHRLN
jgi:hypothetical protein